MESDACLVVAAVFKTVERLLWSLVGSIPSLSAINAPQDRKSPRSHSSLFQPSTRGKDENHSGASAANVGLGSTHTQCVYHAFCMIRNPEEDFYKPA
jgi:hypothetical protein